MQTHGFPINFYTFDLAVCHMPRLILDADELYDFGMIGISSPESAYRFCWVLNREMDWALERSADIEVEKDAAAFATYGTPGEEEESYCRLICNHYLGKILIPELQNANYLLLLYGDFATPEIQRGILDNMAKMEGVFMAEMVEPSKIKSSNKEYLLF